MHSAGKCDPCSIYVDVQLQEYACVVQAKLHTTVVRFPTIQTVVFSKYALAIVAIALRASPTNILNKIVF
jgi:hypothetical protein